MDYQSSDTRLGDSAVCMVYPDQALEHSCQLFTKPLRYQQISLALAPYWLEYSANSLNQICQWDP